MKMFYYIRFQTRCNNWTEIQNLSRYKEGGGFEKVKNYHYLYITEKNVMILSFS
jgi:hypothetical protein